MLLLRTLWLEKNSLFWFIWACGSYSFHQGTSTALYFLTDLCVFCVFIQGCRTEPFSLAEVSALQKSNEELLIDSNILCC